MRTENWILSVLLTSTFLLCAQSYAEETKLEKAETIKNKILDESSKAYRAGKDHTCKMIKGKMECGIEKMENKVKNLSDKTKTKAIEVKNKVD